MQRWWIACSLGVLLCTLGVGDAEDRWRDSKPPWTERFEGSRTWRPDRDRRWRGEPLPDQFTIDKPGKCEVICQRIGREYKCREYRC
jgi:hypothetical protein